MLSPIIVAKYLACRDSPARRKLFRQTRKAIGQASSYAQKQMIDAKGVLNPGLMPQRLEDLSLIAPPRTEVDDVLVERWNRVTDVWRNEAEFRTAVLRYATSNAHRDPASADLWPEVVYPLIERARWHRRIRPRTEAVWDYCLRQATPRPRRRRRARPGAGPIRPGPSGRAARRFAEPLGRQPAARRRGGRSVLRRSRRRGRPPDRLAHQQPGQPGGPSCRASRG